MSFIFDSARKKFADGEIDLLDDTIKVVFVDEGVQVPSQTADEFLDDIASGALVGTPQTLTGKSTTAGVFDAADPTFSGLTGNTFEGVLIYKDTGTASTSPLIAYFNSGDNLPFTPSGTDVPIVWSDGANKIFKL